MTSDVSAWFEWARKQRIAFPVRRSRSRTPTGKQATRSVSVRRRVGVATGIAMSGGFVYTPLGDAVEVQEMMRRFPA
ncbi:MAG: hypothetical protein V7L05_09030 [Nostoc sp.]|uniref:hypothetical protein n=1 Tax=Nostoc sp. TaxID=1180 RepID=UPI002FF5F6FC